MAEANIPVAPLQVSCSVCLHLLKDPVTLPCGHRVCRICSIRCLDQENQKGVYSCPQCKLQAFTPRNVMSNTALDEVTENLLKTTFQFSSPVFCKTHNLFNKHNPFGVSRRQQEQICFQHNKLLDVYCRTDQQSICMSCTMDQHKGHDTVSAAEAQAEIQVQLLQMQDKSKQCIQNRENELQKVKSAVESYKQSSQAAIQEGDRFFAELIKSMERRHYELTCLIKSQESAAVSQAEEIMKELEQEIAELRRRDAQMLELLHTETPVHFLQNFQSVSAALGFAGLRTITYSAPTAFDQLLKTLSLVKEQLETYITTEFGKVANQDAPFSFASDSLRSFTFADLARSSSGFAFKKNDSSFSWANDRTTVFGAKSTAFQNEKEDHNGSVQQMSLSNLTFKSDEEDMEKVLFNQKVTLFKQNQDDGQWKHHGDGDLKILSVKKHYQVLMMCDRILNMYVNHFITKDIEIKFLNISAHTLFWTAINYAESIAKVEQLAAKFTTPESAESFRKIFTDCQRMMM
ncbi:E3 ubiquitin-protein ligase TRIM17-like [Clarias gariepinus]|uniref:E3 ubiquitin-protein ligase TRIM17-like n=1 Tax=Clarias gariepinus TaxID=13013 RepID=UPI00234D8E4B|nr:E3 ubiquitin-protein ligase TRIM17-like [Clarias gariepinus]